MILKKQMTMQITFSPYGEAKNVVLYTIERVCPAASQYICAIICPAKVGHLAISLSALPEECARMLKSSFAALMLADNIKKAWVEREYLNFELDEAFFERSLERVCNILEPCPEIQDINMEYEYAIVRMNMLSRKTSDLSVALQTDGVKQTLWILFSLLEPEGKTQTKLGVCAKYALRYIDKCKLYPVVGRIAQCAEKILYYGMCKL